MDQYCVGASMAVDWGEDEDLRIERGLLRRVFGYFRPYARPALLALACIVALALLGLAPALVFKVLIDELSEADPTFGYVALLVGGGIAAAIVAGLVGLGLSYLTERISQGIIFDLREELFERLLGQPVSFFTDSRAGDLMSRIGNDVNAIDTVIADTAFGTVRNAIVALATLGLMVAFDWRLTLVALALIPLVSLPMRRAGRRSYEARMRTQRKVGEMTEYLQERLGISGILLIKAFVKGPDERRRFRTINDELRHLEIRQSMIARRFGMLLDIVQVAGPALLILAGGYLVVTGRTSVGTVFVFATVLTTQLAGALNDLGNTQVNILGSLALFKRLFELIDRPPEIADAPGARPLGRARGEIQFDGVTFAYPGQQRPALANVSLRVEPGQLVALVGPSGAGKTTLTNLVPRFYDPTAGSVRIDGHDLRELTLQSVGESIALVMQDTFLFHTSVRENLAYARPDASERELIAAASAAHLHDVIGALPDGYDTLVGERGHRLSGGEKQRLAIARAILKDPRILILDEATSSLDTISEQLIQDALRPLLAQRTALVIAHRLSTVLAADAIIVLDRGEILQRGTHAELLEEGGLYRTLYERQFAPGRQPSPA